MTTTDVKKWSMVGSIFDNDQCGECEYLIRVNDPDVAYLSDVYCRVLEGECFPDCPSNCPKLEQAWENHEDV